jgi:hypothetical protein
MSSRIATREFGHFLVKFEVDDLYYVITRIKILTEGRVRMGEYYNVVWGKTDDEADIAEVLDTGDWLDMRKKMTELEVQLNSPVSSPPPSPPESPSQLKIKRPAAKTETTKKTKIRGEHPMHRRAHQRPIRLSSRVPNITTTTSTSFCPVAVNVTVTATNREISFQIFY